MTFLSPVFTFVFLPLALGIYALVPAHRKTDFLPVLGVAFFVCANIGDPFSLIYIVTVCAAVIIATAVFKKTGKKTPFAVCACFCFALAAVILVLRAGTTASVFGCVGLVACLMASVSFSLDVLNGDGRAPLSLWEGVVYVTYFPVMPVGPFVSYGNMIRCFDGVEFGFKNLARGAILMLRGYIKCIAIGAVLGQAYGNVLSAAGDRIGLLAAAVLAAMLSLSVYSYFSGYSDMARGISYALGIKIYPDMGDPFTNPTPAAYMRGFFRGFHRFFKSYIAEPILRSFGDNLFGRLASAFISSMFFLLLFCKSRSMLLVLLPFMTFAEYFVFFGERRRRRSPLPKRVAGCVLTFFVMAAVWLIIDLGSIDNVLAFFGNVLSNHVLGLAPAALGKLMNLKNAAVPIVSALICLAADAVLRRGLSGKEETVGFTVFKSVTAILLLVTFILCVTLLLPQFPSLASSVLEAPFI